MIRFVKGHGTENDFVLLPDPEGALDRDGEGAYADLIRRVCDRRAGVGGDGVLRVVRSAVARDAAAMAAEAEWFMDYRNADGSAVEMCGNGIRVFARFLVEEGFAEPGELAIATRDGVKTVRLGRSGDVTVDMGVARLPGTPRTVTVGNRTWPAVEVDVGNPHAVVFVDELADAGPLDDPPLAEPAFPRGVNVEFVADRGPRHVAMRVHERGVGETRSCGTGACAVMVAAARRDRDGKPAADAASTSYVVDVPGGRLTVAERAEGHVELTGPAVLVAHGELANGWLGANRGATSAPAVSPLT